MDALLGGKIYPTDSTPAAGNKRKIAESPINSSSKRVHLVRGPEGHTTELTVDAYVAGLLDLGKILQRKQRRDLQRRYRKKQNERAVKLETTTKQLRKQVDELLNKRKLLSASLKTYTIWNVAIEYFHLFLHGLKKPETGFLFDFVHKTMVVDVAANSGYGAAAVIKCWDSLYWFEDVKISLEDMQKVTCGSVISTTITSMTITERTLRNVFPALCSSKNDQYCVDKLLGKRITVSGLTFFEWDHKCGRVSSIMTQSDVLRPMLSLLGTIENVSRVFDKALISLDLQWRQPLQSPREPSSSTFED